MSSTIRPFSEIPGPKGIPVLGMAPAFLRDPFAYVESLRPHGPVVKVSLGTRQLVYILEPELVAEVLLRNSKNHTKGQFMERGKIVFGEGLVSSEGELWRRQRALMAPSFHPRAIGGFTTPMLREISNFFDNIAAGERAIDEDMNSLTLRLALLLLFGTTAGADAQRITQAFREMSEYFASAEELLLPLPMSIPTPGHRRFNRAFQSLESVVTRIIAERRRRGEVGTDLLGQLLAARGEDGQAMSEAQLHDEVRTLVLAAHETTAIGLSCTLFLLASHPECQDRLHAELNDSGSDSNGNAAFPQVEAAFKEGLRLYPPVPIIFREPIVEEALGGWQIPAGTTLGLPPWAIQRDPNLYVDPTVFRPERWTREMEAGLHRFAWFPFGGGPRVCVGAALAMQEGRLILAELLRRWRVELSPKSSLQLFPAITLRPKQPIYLRLVAKSREPARNPQPSTTNA
jgi:cytochrome P450